MASRALRVVVVARGELAVAGAAVHRGAGFVVKVDHTPVARYVAERALQVVVVGWLLQHVTRHTVTQRRVRVVHLDGQPGNHGVAGDARKIIMSFWTLPFVTSQARILVNDGMSNISWEPPREIMAG